MEFTLCEYSKESLQGEAFHICSRMVLLAAQPRQVLRAPVSQLERQVLRCASTDGNG